LERLKLAALLSPRQVLKAILWREHKLLHPRASLPVFPVIPVRPRPSLDEPASQRKLWARRQKSRAVRLTGEGARALRV
jgi:hypothetical protein